MATETPSTPNVTKKFFILIIIALVGFGLLIYYQRETLKDTWEALLDARLIFVLLLPLLQVINYFLIGNYYGKMFAQFGTNISQTRSWGVVAAMNFVNQVLPSGGLSGITYLAYGFHSSIESGKTTLIQIGRYVFAFTAYAILLPLAILLLARQGRFEDLLDISKDASGNVGIIITSVLFVVFILLVISLLISDKTSHVLGANSQKVINWFNRTILRRPQVYEFKFLKQLNSEFHDGVSFFKQKGFKGIIPGVFMLLSACVEIAIVYVSVLAVGGGEVGLAPVFFAFIAANIVGVISIIPGDVGVHEATVILVLAAFGVDEPVAISATLLYRVFNKVIFLPIGFYFYTNILKPALEAKKSPKKEVS